MLSSPLTRLAGPMSLVAGALMVAAQLMMLPFDPNDHVATSTDPLYQAGGVVYLAGFLALMVALVGAYGAGLHKAGRLGLIAIVAAIGGTMLLGGDLWFETFAVPWLADEAPAALDADPTLLLGIGAVISYLTFAVGWALFGIAAYRSRVFPKAIGIALVVGGAIGFRALLAPFGIPLALAVISMGVSMLRSRASAETPASGRFLAPRTQYAEATPIA
jgi:hypothetical protein